MEDIKFRAWNKNTKKIVSNQKLTDMTVLGLSKGLDPDNFILLPTKSDYIIMQCTGLLDKNGVEIYEGDIYRSIGDAVFQVMFVGGAFVGGTDEEYCSPIGWKAETNKRGEHTDEVVSDNELLKIMEVIGNIYEDRELLDI